MADFTPQQIEQFLQEFFDVVGTRQYTGARYVPIFGRAGSDTVEWDNLEPYEPLTVVMHEGVSYVSRRYVPNGIQITDTEYWAQTYRFNAQVEAYRREVLSFQGQIDQLRDDMETDYVPFPDSDTYPKYGLLGQVLTTLTGGATKWEDPVTVDADVAEPLIEAWLDDHPEATTTVQDGAITWAKLNDSLKPYLLHSGNVYVNGTNWQTVLPDADGQPNNTVYVMDTGVVPLVQNMPSATIRGGVLLKINYSNASGQGCVQLYVTKKDNDNNPYVYARVALGGGNTPTFTNWKELLTEVKDGTVTWPKLNDSLKPYLLHGENVLVTSNNYQTVLPDADGQPNNTVYVVDTASAPLVQNLPAGTVNSGVLFKINYSNTNGQGCLQVYATRKNDGNPYVYVRVALGSGDTPTFTPWTEVLTGSVTWGKIDDSAKPYVLHGEGVYINAANYETDLPDADGQPNNTVYVVDTGVVPLVQNLPPRNARGGVLLKINYSNASGQGCVQIYASKKDDGNPYIYGRVALGGGTTPTFTAWKELTFNNDVIVNNITSHKTCSIFKKVVCCGDSYTCGWINNDRFNDDYSWPHYMELITGNEYINCGHSGTTVLTWQTESRGLPKATQAGVSQAYIIGLMINDVIREVPLGSVSDIGTQAQTYYGGLSQIVEALNGISPNAKIFIQTCPRTTASFQPYNQAVRDVVQHYANTMHTHLLDLYAYMYLYDRPEITNDALLGHYTAIGYQQFAENLTYIMSDYINAHITDFQDVYSLPTS